MKIQCAFGPFLPVPPVMGGAVERIFLTLCKKWAASGHEVQIVCRQFKGMPHTEIIDGVKLHRIPSFNAPKNKLLYRFFDIIYALRVRRLGLSADITITHSVSMPLLLNTAKAGLLYVSVARFPKRQMWLYRRASRLQAVSSHVANAIREQSPSVTSKVETVHNCISEAFEVESARELTEKAKVIIFVGRVAREKGIHILIRAFQAIAKRYPEWKLLIVGPHTFQQGGDGPAFLGELQSQINDSASHIEFVGPVFDEQMLIDYIRNASIFVYPSVASAGESFGLAPLEAMACGCACVLSKLDCFNDYALKDQNALFFDETDDSGSALSSVLMTLMDSEPLRKKLGLAGKATSLRFLPETIGNQFIEDFHALLATENNNSLYRNSGSE